MTSSNDLLTVVVETPSQLNRESEIYRNLASARLDWESRYSIVTSQQSLTTTVIADYLQTVKSKYIIFMRDSHRISDSYMHTMLNHLAQNNLFLAEPLVYMGEIPVKVSNTIIDDSYYYKRDTDIFGVAFNVGQLRDAMEALNDLDRASLYTAYRIYWSIDKISPLLTGYSVASVTKVAIGIVLENHVQRLLPTIPTHSKELRLYVFQLLILFLRGLRETKSTNISVTHLRELIRLYQLEQFKDLAELLNSN